MDLKIDETGELVINGFGDLDTVTVDDEVAQNVYFRLQTVKGDCVVNPNIGSSLEQFIGSPNTQDTYNQMKLTISQDLARNGLLVNPDIYISAIDEFTVGVLVEFPGIYQHKLVQIQSMLDLRKGLVFSRLITV